VTTELAWSFHAVAVLTLVGVPLYAWRLRGRAYAIYACIILLLSLPGAVVTHARIAMWLPPAHRAAVDAAFLFSMAAAGLHLAHLVQARLRSLPFRLGVSVPGQVFIAAGFLSGLWQLLLLPPRWGCELAGFAGAARALDWLDPVPLIVAVLSVFTSSRRTTEWVRVHLGDAGPPEVERVAVDRFRSAPSPLAQRRLRIVQIADPHLGPWQTVARLRETLRSLLAHEPELVLLTGDFLTMEGRGTPGALAEALAPLRPIADRCYAIFGNHDLESPEEVRQALAANGIALLVDDEAVASTPVGPVQILGADYVRRERCQHLAGLLARFPRREGHLRLLLLHDPQGFHCLADGEVDLTLSGHTHGGQLGLVSFGLDWTVLSRSRWPDHGLFARGSNRLYVHRGNGFYGFPLRVGVPGENSVLELVLP
jgi:predicted MPP superfamily phosphohydrolase